MSLETDTLEQLARKNMAIGPVAEDASLEAPWPSAAPAAPGDGVDVSGALWAVVSVVAVGGGLTFKLRGRRKGAADWTGTTINGAGEVVLAADGDEWSDLVRVGPLDELAIEVLSGTATDATITIAPCLG